MHITDILLDDKIRDWVLLPIVLVVFLVAIVRQNVSLLIQGERKPELKKIQERQILLRSQRLRVNGKCLSKSSFDRRKSFFNDPSVGIFKEPEQREGDSNPLMNPAMMDPMNMMDMLKNNITMVVPQLVIMTWVSHFFSGFVIVKVPFPLTVAFRGMLQRGIELDSLAVTWVSSLSWYFLVLFGLRGVNSLVLGEGNAADDAKLMQQQMDATAVGADTKKLFQSEKENLELVEHKWHLEDAEKRLLSK